MMAITYENKTVLSSISAGDIYRNGMGPSGILNYTLLCDSSWSSANVETHEFAQRPPSDAVDERHFKNIKKFLWYVSIDFNACV